jgi:hypothetical protein
MPVPHPAQIGSVRLQPDSQTVRWSGLAQLVQSSPSFCEQSAYQPIGARSSRSTTVRSVRVRWLSCPQASRCSGVPAIRPAGSTVRSDRGPGPSDSLLRRLCWLVEHSKEPRRGSNIRRNNRLGNAPGVDSVLARSAPAYRRACDVAGCDKCAVLDSKPIVNRRFDSTRIEIDVSRRCRYGQNKR